MAQPQLVPSPETLNLQSVERYLEEIREKSESGSKELRLDWQDLRHVEAPAASILSQALIGALGSYPLVVIPPSRFRRLEALFRSGLLFALANREGHTTVYGTTDPILKWKHSWTPGNLSSIRALFTRDEPSSEQGRLFEPSSGELPDVFGRYHAAFINPHRLPPSGSHEAIRSVVSPWLSEVLPNVRGIGPKSSEGDDFLSDVNAVIEELLQTFENMRRAGWTAIHRSRWYSFRLHWVAARKVTIESMFQCKTVVRGLLRPLAQSFGSVELTMHPMRNS